jgi:hypothetical protein
MRGSKAVVIAAANGCIAARPLKNTSIRENHEFDWAKS